VNSAFENFIPEVKPGNQTALNTRAAPFAAFIAQMHRNIHRLWGFGALEDWDELSSSSPFNDESLMTTLEIVLNRDGTVSKVTPVRASKYLPFEAAAIDVVYSAGPYADPPREIRSGNGKIYVHWSFFRDGRQCATTGVDYYILNNAPKDGDLADGSDSRAPPPTAAAQPPPPEQRSPPRRLERNLGEGTPGGGGGHRRVVAAAVPEPESAPSGSPEGAAAATPRSEDTAAGQLAHEWFAAFARGDIHAMTSRAGFPFRSASGVAAQKAGDLARMLTALVAETPGRSVAEITVETSAGLRKRIGKLPPGLDDGSGLLFAVTRSDGDTLILVLARSGNVATGGAAWKAVGLIRR